MSPCSRLDQF